MGKCEGCSGQCSEECSGKCSGECKGCSGQCSKERSPGISLVWRVLSSLLTACVILGMLVASIKLYESKVYAIDVINLTKNTVISLPLTVYRYWDIIAALVYFALFLIPFKKNEKGEYTSMAISFPLGASAGFVFGTISVITADSLLASLVICLIIGVGLTLLISTVSELEFEIGGAVGYSIVIGLCIGIGNIVSLGIIGGLAISIIFWVVISLLVIFVQKSRAIFTIPKSKDQEDQKEEIEEESGI